MTTHPLTPGIDRQDVAIRLPRKWRRLFRHPLFWIGGSMLALLLLFSFLGPVFDKAAGEHYDMATQLFGPSFAHPLGTNVLGQDELAQLMVGGQRPILAGFATAIAAAIIGIATGLVAGYSGSVFDSVLMRITDMFLSIPQVVPILLIESLLGASTKSLIIVVALTAWPAAARIIRARTLIVRRQPFIEAAIACGDSHARILVHHVLPNLLDDIVVASTNLFANVVLVMAITTFIGLGLPPPWNWASMFAGNMDNIVGGQWWVVYPPGLAFSVLLVSVYFLGEAVRSALNPQESMEAQ
ncbi:MAG: ABC transporter permease [Thermaerobacter sp.]|nr:ABC transporter permease [Thermaerobacter sp.]